MRNRFVGLTVVLLICASAVSCRREWKEYVYAKDGLTISFPAIPTFDKQVVKTVLGPIKSHTYSIDLGGGLGFAVTVTDFGYGDPLPRQSLQDAKNGSLKETKAKLVSEKEISLDGTPGLEIEIETQTSHAQARYYLLKRKLVTLISSAPAGKAFSTDTQRFFGSLKLLKN
jgi:hypothetical protein